MRKKYSWLNRWIADVNADNTLHKRCQVVLHSVPKLYHPQTTLISQP